MKGAGDFDWFIQALNKDLLFLKPSVHPNVFPTMASFSIWFYKIGWKLLQWCKLCLENIPLLFSSSFNTKIRYVFFLLDPFWFNFQCAMAERSPRFKLLQREPPYFHLPAKMLTSAIITFLRIGDLFFQNLVKITFPSITKHFQH